MSTLFKFIFYKLYYFYFNIFKERQIPHHFAFAIISLLIMCGLYDAFKWYSFYFSPKSIDMLDYFYGPFYVLVAVSLIYYLGKNKRYLKILKECQLYSKRKKWILAIISIVFILAIFVLFFQIGNLIHDKNIETNANNKFNKINTTY